MVLHQNKQRGLKGRKLTNMRCPGRSEKTEGMITETLHELERGIIMIKLPRDK